MANWSKWYREGLVTIQAGSKTVTGTDTYWLSAGLHPGDIFSLDGVTDYELDTVTDNTHLTLRTVYKGESISSGEYHIVRNFTASTESEVAAETAGLVQKMARYVDSDMQTVQGKSAYEIAKDEGYTGTASAWLESLKGKDAYTLAVEGGYKGTREEWFEYLKAAGEWSALDSRTKMLAEANQARLHNMITRCKNLGDHVTDEQWAVIKNRTYTDLYIGDYWLIDGVRYHIAHFEPEYFIRGILGYDVETGQRREVGNVSGGWITMLPSTCPIKGDQYFYVEEEDKNANGSWVGYTGCHYTRVVRPLILAKLREIFGSNHLVEWFHEVTTGISAEGVPTGWGGFVNLCELPTYEQVMGYRPHTPELTTNTAINFRYNWNCRTPGQLALCFHQAFGQSFGGSVGSSRTRDIYGTWGGIPTCYVCATPAASGDLFKVTDAFQPRPTFTIGCTTNS